MDLLPETVAVTMPTRLACPLCGATSRAPRSSMHAVRYQPAVPVDQPLQEFMLIETTYVEVPVCAGCGVSLPEYKVTSDGYIDELISDAGLQMSSQHFDPWRVTRDGLIYRAYADAKWPLKLCRVRKDSRTWLARLYVVTPPYNPVDGLWQWNEPELHREYQHG